MTTPPTVADYLKCVLDVDSHAEGFHRDRETLQELVDARVRVRHIAEAAAVSERAIYKQLKKHGIDPPHSDGQNNDGSANAHEPYQTLADLNPDAIGMPTPEGDDRWQGNYRESDEGEV